MLDNKFDQELLGKIKEKKIIPKWHFLLKDYMVWFFGVLSLIIGSLSFSVIIYLVKFHDWDAYNQIGESFLSFMFLTLPYFWVLFLIFFGFLVHYNIKHTKKGYKYSFKKIIIANVVISALLGALFFHVGIGQAIDDVLGARAPFYSEIINRGMHFWCQPEEGRLPGMIIEIRDVNSFRLIDIHEKEWIVEHNGEFKDKIKINIPIRMVGVMINESTFKAEEILPAMRPGRGMFERGDRRGVHDCGDDCGRVKGEMIMRELRMR